MMMSVTDKIMFITLVLRLTISLNNIMIDSLYMCYGNFITKKMQGSSLILVRTPPKYMSRGEHR